MNTPLFPITISERIEDQAQATLLEGDTLVRLRDVPSNSVKLVITSTQLEKNTNCGKV
jgi:hypothetical protein